MPFEWITCRRLLYIFPVLLFLWLCSLGYELYYAFKNDLREQEYFWRLENREHEQSYRHVVPTDHSISGSRPYRADNIEPLFPELVQLSTFGYKKSLRLYEDDTCQFPFEHVWIYVAGRKTCPKQDGPEMCEDFIQAFDRLLEYHHTQRPAANAFLSFVDCDISPNLCRLWEVESNIMINMQSLSPCDVHMPEDIDPEYRLQCPVVWRFIGLPLETMPYRSPAIFPSAFEQLKALTNINGFVDAIDPLPGYIKLNYTDLMKLHGENQLNELQRDSTSTPSLIDIRNFPSTSVSERLN